MPDIWRRWVVNSAENYLKYKIPPNTRGKNSNGITGYFRSIGSGGSNAVLTSSLPAVTSIVSSTNNAVKMTWETVVIGKTLHGITDHKKLQNEIKPIPRNKIRRIQPGLIDNID
ncbi:hypothetical protein [Legionella sainthelensi]|uniref:hypothetical protein n=1 Tax=Legionella sainthelensi TaxID=28087 RepID=UPI000E20C7DE|nr:hypothetical protein [Legionella sainthelensi]